MKTHSPSHAKIRGFALIVTIALMLLLAVITVGLLSLATVTIRSTNTNKAQLTAQANARLALTMAIAQLQKSAGDDRRITMAADQLGNGNGEPSARPAYRHWTTITISTGTDDKDPDTVTYTGKANNLTAGSTNNSGQALAGGASHSGHFAMNMHSFYFGTDRSGGLGMGGVSVDTKRGDRRVGRQEAPRQNAPGNKPNSARLYADDFPAVYPPLNQADARPLEAGQLLNEKAPILFYSYQAKTEANARNNKTLSRFNPRASYTDFYDLSQQELDLLPYEIEVEPLISWVNDSGSLENNPSGQGFFGGGYGADSGTNYVTLYSVPHQPVLSLGAFQHSGANGFLKQRPANKPGRTPMLPQIAHAIGNSRASSFLQADQTHVTIAGGRFIADHSYLANRRLWDAWFLSGITPQTADSFTNKKSLQEVASDFFDLQQLPGNHPFRHRQDQNRRPPGKRCRRQTERSRQ